MCEYGMVTLDWEGSHCELHTVPATQKAKGSLGSLVREQWPPPSPNTETGTAIVRSTAQKNLRVLRVLICPNHTVEPAKPSLSPPA